MFTQHYLAGNLSSARATANMHHIAEWGVKKKKKASKKTNKQTKQQQKKKGGAKTQIPGDKLQPLQVTLCALWEKSTGRNRLKLKARLYLFWELCFPSPDSGGAACTSPDNSSFSLMFTASLFGQVLKEKNKQTEQQTSRWSAAGLLLAEINVVCDIIKRWFPRLAVVEEKVGTLKK